MKVLGIFMSPIFKRTYQVISYLSSPELVTHVYIQDMGKKRKTPVQRQSQDWRCLKKHRYRVLIMWTWRWKIFF
jgi:hypothetical protein